MVSSANSGGDGHVPRRRHVAPVVSPLRRWNRFAFRFFGPPSVGRYDGPYPDVDPDPACPHCGHHESAHAGYRSADGKTLRRCPS